MLYALKKAPKLLLRSSAKPAAWVTAFAAVTFLMLDLVDGAKHRINERCEQVQNTVEPAAVETFSKVSTVCHNLWDSILANPGPSILAILVFAATVIYHKTRGTSLVNAVTAAVTRAPIEEKKDPLLEKIKNDLVIKQMTENHELLVARQKAIGPEIDEAKKKAEAADAEAKATENIARINRNKANLLADHYAKLFEERQKNEKEINELELAFDKADFT